MAKSRKSARKKARPSRAASRRSVPTFKRAYAVATAAKRAPAERIDALALAPTAVCENDNTLQTVLGVVRDSTADTDLRLKALRTLQAASFSVVRFESCRTDYIATLRAVADDADPVMRERALGILAQEKDGFAQKRLLEGLKKADKALVTPQKALQFLSYDPHAEAYTVARQMVAKPPNDATKRAALRLLSADASAAPIFEKVLRDKNEGEGVRQISAVALRSLKPERLQEHARNILLDESEAEPMHAMSLTALSQFGNRDAIDADDEVAKRVNALGRSASKRVKQSAKRYLSKIRGT